MAQNGPIGPPIGGPMHRRKKAKNGWEIISFAFLYRKTAERRDFKGLLHTFDPTCGGLGDISLG